MRAASVAALARAVAALPQVGKSCFASHAFLACSSDIFAVLPHVGTSSFASHARFASSSRERLSQATSSPASQSAVISAICAASDAALARAVAALPQVGKSCFAIHAFLACSSDIFAVLPHVGTSSFASHARFASSSDIFAVL